MSKCRRSECDTCYGKGEIVSDIDSCIVYECRDCEDDSKPDERAVDRLAATPDPARLAAEEVCAMFGPAWVKYTASGLPFARVADIIRKHDAEMIAAKDSEIERLRAQVKDLARAHNAYAEKVRDEMMRLHRLKKLRMRCGPKSLITTLLGLSPSTPHGRS